MKKLILIAAVAFTACGSPKTIDVTCDSTCTDSTNIDTLNTRGVVDTTILKTVK